MQTALRSLSRTENEVARLRLRFSWSRVRTRALRAVAPPFCDLLCFAWMSIAKLGLSGLSLAAGAHTDQHMPLGWAWAAPARMS
jgi:hypothetical protein